MLAFQRLAKLYDACRHTQQVQVFFGNKKPRYCVAAWLPKQDLNLRPAG